MGAVGTRQPPARLRKALYQADLLAEPPPVDLAEVLARYRGRSDALVTVLQEVQGLYGYLPDRAMKYAARALDVPLARIYGVATFYNQFLFAPPGRIQLRVCCGTACHVGGAPGILRALKAHMGIEEAQTTPDRLFTLQTVYCVGGCSLAPVVLIGGEAHGRMTPVAAVTLVDGLRAREEAPP